MIGNITLMYEPVVQRHLPRALLINVQYIHTLSSYVEGSTVRVGSLPTRLEALNYYTYVP